MLIRRLQLELESLLGLQQYRWRALPEGVYILNLHRIGIIADTQLDPNVFSCSPERLEQHLRYLLGYFQVISLGELIAILDGVGRARERCLLVTFDDGYQDNYELAYPILKRLNVPAIFFIATGLIENNELPWWDKVAYLIQHSHITKLRLDYWKDAVEHSGERRIFIRLVLNQIKQCKVALPQQIHDLEHAIGIQPSYPNAEFMTWNNILAMSEDGMDIGAHSHSHDILTKLADEEMLYELQHSKALLESHLKKPVKAFSYPVGSKNSYNEGVIEALKDSGYEIAFNFLPGINIRLAKNRYDLRRFPIDYEMDERALKMMLSYADRV